MLADSAVTSAKIANGTIVNTDVSTTAAIDPKKLKDINTTHGGAYLRKDGSWQVPPDNNTTYSVVSKTAAGLAPQLPNESTVTKYLRQDGSWVAPPTPDTVINRISNIETTVNSIVTASKFTTSFNNTITNGNLNLPQIDVNEFRSHNGFVTVSSGTYYCKLPSNGTYNCSLFVAYINRNNGSPKKFSSLSYPNQGGNSNLCTITNNESAYVMAIYTRIN
jgi:hypothetical protein